MKMLAIGLGKHIGASFYHSQGLDRMHEVIPMVGQHVINHTKIGFSIAIIENAYKEIATIKAVPAENIREAEPLLLEEAKALMPRIEVDEADILIIDEMGKNISGPGMDPNITGRSSNILLSPDFFNAPKFQRILPLDLIFDGNATGIGLADVIPRRILDKIDFRSTYANCITSALPQAAKIPIITNNDLEAFVVALKTCSKIEYSDIKVVRIKNTSEVMEIKVSASLINQIQKRKHCEILPDPNTLTFDSFGNLLPYGAN